VSECESSLGFSSSLESVRDQSSWGWGVQVAPSQEAPGKAEAARQDVSCKELALVIA